ncbi:histidine kinase N-terminal 7TM domain-containing diguanylate cyclase [Planococcus ruber]|uniref:histidine kinase N-terminal 7TM domain-containing diguanylate cyclase n=1 Tax=Planococcus ruber TaxID=2027871 RepID=UPI002441E5E3|nr:histidine kinase N-terminal 7TM domain-containing protein [Planococcus ruber]
MKDIIGGIHIISLNFILSSILFLFTFCYMVLLHYAWQNRATPISISYGLGVMAAFFYTFGYAFQLLSTTVEHMMFWIHIQYFGIAFAPFVWIVMVLQFTGNHRFLKKKWLALWLLGPIYTLSAHFTNEWHHLFYRNAGLDGSLGFPLIDLDRGPLFYIHIGCIYSYHLIGIGLLVNLYLKANKERKKQAALMMIGSLFVFGVPFIHSIGAVKVPIDISPFGLVISSLFYLWGINRFNLLKLSPLAMKKVFESINDAVVIFDTDNQLKLYNKSAKRLLAQLPDKKLIGHPAAEVLSQFPSLVQFIERSTKTSAATQSMQLKDKHYTVHFSYVEGSNHQPIGKMFILHDITESIKYEKSLLEQSKQFEYLAHHDVLTGLYNRTYFEEEVKRKLAQPGKTNAAMVLCDLNFFKEINDVYGHLTGDHVLMFTANCWREHLPEPSILARLGGDEFIMFFEHIASKETFMKQIHEVRSAFQENLFRQDGIEIEVVPSIGAAFVEEDGNDYEHLYHTCDTRMYKDKKKTKAFYV